MKKGVFMEFGYRRFELEIIQKVPAGMLLPLVGMSLTGAFYLLKSDEDSLVNKIRRLFGFHAVVLSGFLLVGVLKTRDVRQIRVSELFDMTKNVEFLKDAFVFFKNLK